LSLTRYDREGLVKTKTGSVFPVATEDATIHGNSSEVYENLRKARQPSCWQTS